MVEVAVSDTDPRQAATIANCIASTFVKYIGEQAVAQSELPRWSIDQQIADLEGQIAALDERIATLQTYAQPRLSPASPDLHRRPGPRGGSAGRATHHGAQLVDSPNGANIRSSTPRHRHFS